MFAFLLGLMVGICGFWIVVVERLRTALYHEKLGVYLSVQDALTRLFQAANLLKTENRPTRETIAFFESADLDLLNTVAEGALITDRKILHLAGEICDYDHGQVKENFQEYLKSLDRLVDVMRADLEVDRLQRLTKFFASAPPADPIFKSLTPAKDQVWKALSASLKNPETKKESDQP